MVRAVMSVYGHDFEKGGGDSSETRTGGTVDDEWEGPPNSISNGVWRLLLLGLPTGLAW